ncbi:MAG: hypothetical protein OZSIB_4297 [Candidatus Ozemobacter sibiricus]|uniref:Uncharacterized protein n=1 Tax=Candidatus Ozemobacter sibiricus TaxID=2268124 RepID=A0A367ZN53_9BACT|nr:MAG: hypothetical protein OZSIB_4297 [Candidatus Ozemobacter sibiricus]
MRHHLVQALLRRLVKARQPREALQQIKDQAATVIGLLEGTVERGGRRASREQVAGTVMVGGSLLYWAGWLVLPLWIPILGAAVGVVGAAGVVAGFRWWQEAHRNFHFLKTYYAFLQMMEMADGVITVEESRYLNDFLLSLPLSAAQRKELQAIEATDLSAIEVPEWYEASHREAILAGCWSLAYCDEIAPVEEALFTRMAERLAVPPDTVARIKADVSRQLEETETLLVHIGAETAQLTPTFSPTLQNALLDCLAAVNARGDSQDRLRQRINFGTPIPLPDWIAQSPDHLLTVLMGAGTTHAILTDQPDNGPEAKWRAALQQRGEALGAASRPLGELIELAGQTIQALRQASRP